MVRYRCALCVVKHVLLGSPWKLEFGSNHNSRPRYKLRSHLPICRCGQRDAEMIPTSELRQVYPSIFHAKPIFPSMFGAKTTRDGHCLLVGSITPAFICYCTRFRVSSLITRPCKYFIWCSERIPGFSLIRCFVSEMRFSITDHILEYSLRLFQAPPFTSSASIPDRTIWSSQSS